MFHEKQESGYCGLHSIRNLLRNKVITKEELDMNAKKCAELSGDSLSNHMTTHGFWSIETLLCCLQSYRFKIQRPFFKGKWILKDMKTLLDDPKSIGFLVHKNYHYSCVRKNDHGTGWEYSNSNNDGPIPVKMEGFEKSASEQICNLFFITL